MAVHPRKTRKQRNNAAVSRKISRLKREGKPQKQAIAIAVNTFLLLTLFNERDL